MLHIRLHKRTAFYVLVVILAWADFVLNTVVAVIEQGPSNVFRLSFLLTFDTSHFYTPAMTLLFGHHVELGYISAFYIFLGLVALSVWNTLCGMTGWEPIGLLPMKYLRMYGLIIVITACAAQNINLLVRFFAHQTIAICLVIYVFSYLGAQARDRKVALLSLDSQSSSDTPSEAQKQTAIKKCEICEQESSTQVCPSCERKYQAEDQRVRAQILRARQAGVAATLTLKEWLQTLDKCHWHCIYCHGPFEVLEHYLPIPYGGTTAKNCVPACRKCNLKKSNKHPEKGWPAKAKMTDKELAEEIRKLTQKKGL